MKAKEVYKGFKSYTAKILVKNPHYSVHMDAIVNAKMWHKQDNLSNYNTM